MNLETWKRRARELSAQTYALYLAYRHPRTPWYAKVFAALIVGYVFSPIDPIPDFIPGMRLAPPAGLMSWQLSCQSIFLSYCPSFLWKCSYTEFTIQYFDSVSNIGVSKCLFVSSHMSPDSKELLKVLIEILVEEHIQEAQGFVLSIPK